MIEVAIEALDAGASRAGRRGPMVKKYGELYLNARKALRPSQGDNASVYARELLSLASGKSVAALLADRELYASEEIEEKLNGFLARILAGEPLAYILGEWSFLRAAVSCDAGCSHSARRYDGCDRSGNRGGKNLSRAAAGSGFVHRLWLHRACACTLCGDCPCDIGGYLRAGASRGQTECGKSAAQKAA